MPRRHIAIIVIALFLGALTIRASDSWVGKDWKDWSKGDCEDLLSESPWAHSWRAGLRVGWEASASGDALVYSLQLRSALPIRQAIVRKLQLDQKYDKMTEDQNKSFDSQAAQILNRRYDDVVLVHVDFSKSTVAPRLRGDLGAYVHSGIEKLEAVMVTDDGTQLKVNRFDMSPRGLNEFDLIFPRLLNGTPAIKAGQKRLSVQFQSPQLLQVFGTDIPTRRVTVDFNIEKMSFGGKLSY